MEKAFCDVCGKEMIPENRHYFDDFDTCSECHQIIENHYELWGKVKLDTFRKFVSEMKKAAAAKKPAAKKPVAIKTTCCGKCGQHKHELVTAKPAAKQAGKKPAAKTLTTAELAKEIGKKTNIVQCYSYRHGLGIIDKKRRVRVFNQEDADKVRKHFQK